MDVLWKSVAKHYTQRVLTPLTLLPYRLSNRLADFMIYKSSHAQLQRNEDIIRYFKTMPVPSELGA